MDAPHNRLEHRTSHMTVWLEPPDLVCVRAHGQIEEQDMVDVAAHLSKHIRPWPYVLLFVDQTEQTGISPGGRKAAATVFDWVPYRGTAFSGGSFAMRTVGQMVMTIVNKLLVNKQRAGDNPTKFFKTESEARAWIEERRRAIASGSK